MTDQHDHELEHESEDGGTHTIVLTRADVAAALAVSRAGLDLTRAVFRGVWGWFPDVELVVPLNTVVLDGEERRTLTAAILSEMDDVFAGLQAEADAGGDVDELAAGPGGQRVNGLFRELAGCWPELVNSEVEVLPDAVRVQVQAEFVANAAEQMGVPEEEVRFQLRTNTTLRMSLRMNGLDPDAIG